MPKKKKEKKENKTNKKNGVRQTNTVIVNVGEHSTKKETKKEKKGTTTTVKSGGGYKSRTTKMPKNNPPDPNIAFREYLNAVNRIPSYHPEERKGGILEGLISGLLLPNISRTTPQKAEGGMKPLMSNPNVLRLPPSRVHSSYDVEANQQLIQELAYIKEWLGEAKERKARRILNEIKRFEEDNNGDNPETSHLIDMYTGLLAQATERAVAESRERTNNPYQTPPQSPRSPDAEPTPTLEYSSPQQRRQTDIINPRFTQGGGERADDTPPPMIDIDETNITMRRRPNPINIDESNITMRRGGRRANSE